MNSQKPHNYYVPESSAWPIIGSIGLFLTVIGLINWLHNGAIGPYICLAGVLTVIYMVSGWFYSVIRESRAGLYSEQMDRSFRIGMYWFLFTELVFFSAFFAALFYLRFFSIPWLAGAGSGLMTHILEWPNFQASWPLVQTPDPSQFLAKPVNLDTWGIPALSTLLLLLSSLSFTIAHWGLVKDQRAQLIIGQFVTIILGTVFLALQVRDMILAYGHGLTLAAGAFGSIFFMITGVHAVHILIGLIILAVILLRSIRGHFAPTSYFAFQAAAWYWNFISVTWLASFIFVYWW